MRTFIGQMRRFARTSCVGRVPIHSLRTRCVAIASSAITTINSHNLFILLAFASCPLYYRLFLAYPEPHLGNHHLEPFALIAPVIDSVNPSHSSGAGTWLCCDGRCLLPLLGSHRKWTLAPVRNHTPNASRTSSWQPKRLLQMTLPSLGSKRSTRPTSSSSSTNVIGAFAQRTEG